MKPSDFKFFTWVDLPENAQMSEVPLRMRAQLRVLWLNGCKVEELAKLFHLPEEWVDVFVREEARTTTH